MGLPIVGDRTWNTIPGMTVHGIEERRDVSEEDVVTSHNSRRNQAVLLSFKNPFQHDGREVAKTWKKS